MRHAIRFAVCTILLALSARLQGQVQPIVIGERARLHSTVLNEDRSLLVYTPPGYAGGTAKYPVIYLLDGDAHFLPVSGIARFLADLGLAPEMIVVGIPNTDRTRDLTTPDPTDTAHQNPTAGGADRFLSFLTGELEPYVDAHYRTAPFRILIGHSLGGLFAVHALVQRPDAFNAFIAMSPSLWWDDQFELGEARTFLVAHAKLTMRFFMSLGSEGEGMQKPFRGMTALLEEHAPSGFTWHHLLMPEETHGTIPLRSAFEGLKFVFTGYAFPASPADSGLAQIIDHFSKLSSELGYTIDPPERAVNLLGYGLLGRKKIDEAIAVFLHNVKAYPQSANTYDSAADGYEAAHQTALARENCETACRLGEKNDDPNLPLYLAHRKRLAGNGEKK